MVSTSKAVEDNKQRKSSYDVGGSSAPKAFDSDAILQSLGFGWFQVKFLVFMAYGLAFPQAAIFVYNFLGATIPHRCFIEGCDDIRLLRNQTPRFVDPAINVTTGQPLDGWMGPAILGALAADMNRTVDERLWKCSYQRGLFNATPPCAKESYKPGQACSKGWVYLTNSQDDRVPIQSSITTDFDLVCDDSWKPTFGNFLTLLGLLIGTIFLAPLPDVIGRKKAMGIFTIMMCAFGIGSAFAPNWDGFAGMRFLTGMGGQPALMAFGLWGMEAMAPSMRFPFYCAMAIASAIGNCLSGLAAYLIRDWSTLQLVIFVPFTCILVCQFFLPESARWLASKKRYEEAKKIFTDAAKLNKVTIPPELLLIPGEENPGVIGKDSEGVNLTTEEESTNPFRMFGEILRTPCLLKRVFILFCAWFAQLSLNYGLASASTNLDNGLGPYVNYVLVMVVDFPSIAVVVVVVYFLGRRIIMNIGLIGGGISCLIAGLVEDDETITVTFANLGKFFVTMFATTNYVMTAELFPTPARGIATAAITTAGKIGSIVSPYISNLGSTDQRLPYIIYGAIALFAGLLTLLLPETKDLPMPNTVQEAKDLERTNLKWSSFTFWKKNTATHQFSQ